VFVRGFSIARPLFETLLSSQEISLTRGAKDFSEESGKFDMLASGGSTPRYYSCQEENILVQVTLQLLAGALACVLLILVSRALGRKGELRLYALSLIVAALIYVGFTTRGASSVWLVVELAGLVSFTFLAWLGLRISPWALALGWALHAAWDAFLHKLSDAPFVPGWYPLVCLSFDLVLALYILMSFKRSRAGD
jgi:hypothetical protein